MHILSLGMHSIVRILVTALVGVRHSLWWLVQLITFQANELIQLLAQQTFPWNATLHSMPYHVGAHRKRRYSALHAYTSAFVCVPPLTEFSCKLVYRPVLGVCIVCLTTQHSTFMNRLLLLEQHTPVGGVMSGLGPLTHTPTDHCPGLRVLASFLVQQYLQSTTHCVLPFPLSLLVFLCFHALCPVVQTPTSLSLASPITLL